VGGRALREQGWRRAGGSGRRGWEDGREGRHLVHCPAHLTCQGLPLTAGPHGCHTYHTTPTTLPPLPMPPHLCNRRLDLLDAMAPGGGRQANLPGWKGRCPNTTRLPPLTTSLTWEDSGQAMRAEKNYRWATPGARRKKVGGLDGGPSHVPRDGNRRARRDNGAGGRHLRAMTRRAGLSPLPLSDKLLRAGVCLCHYRDRRHARVAANAWAGATARAFLRHNFFFSISTCRRRVA